MYFLKTFNRITLGLILLTSLINFMPLQSLACGSATGSSANQILYGTGQASTDCSGTGVTNVANTVVNILSIVVGIAAIIVIIISGLRFITSSGDSGKVSSAKNSLIYAIIGLVIAALTQLLVHFVLNTTENAQPCYSNPNISQLSPKCK